MESSRRQLQRDIIDHGLTVDDLGPWRFGRSATAVARRDLGIVWPAGKAPRPAPLDDEPDPSDPLPAADVVVITWTVDELRALADVLSPRGP